MEEWFVSDSENYNCCLAFIHTVFFIVLFRWRAAHSYIVEAKLTREVVEQCVRDSKIELR